MNTPKIQRQQTEYSLRLRGADLYRVCHLLEQVALESNCYVTVREAVELAELMRNQAKTQGWTHDTPRFI